MSLLCCGLEEQNLCHALAPPWMMILTCRQRLDDEERPACGDMSNGAKQWIKSTLIIQLYKLYTVYKNEGNSNHVCCRWDLNSFEGHQFPKKWGTVSSVHCNIALRVFLPLFWPTCADLQFSGILELFSLRSFQDGFSRSGENAFFSSKNFHLQRERMRMLKGTTWMMKPTTKPAPPIGEAGTCSLWASTAICKGCLEDRKPFGGRGDLWKGKLLEPKM